MERQQPEPHVFAVLAVIGALYEDVYSVVMGCLVDNGGRMRESDLAMTLRLPARDMRTIVSRLATDGLLAREVAPKKDEQPLANELGSAGPAWRSASDDSFVSVDFDRFALVVRYRVAVMLKSLATVDEANQKYVCTSPMCPDSGRLLTLFDMVFNSPAVRSLQCPRKECRGAPVRSVVGPSGLTAEEADDTKRRLNMRFAPLLGLIHRGEEFLKAHRTSMDMTPAGRQFAGSAGLVLAAQPAAPAPPPSSSSSAAGPLSRRPDLGLPEFTKSSRQRDAAGEDQSRAKRQRPLEPEPVAPVARLLDPVAEQQELAKLAAWEAAAARSWKESEVRWTVKGVAYCTEELTDELVATMEPDEAARYARWYEADGFVFDE